VASGTKPPAANPGTLIKGNLDRRNGNWPEKTVPMSTTYVTPHVPKRQPRMMSSVIPNVSIGIHSVLNQMKMDPDKRFRDDGACAARVGTRQYTL